MNGNIEKKLTNKILLINKKTGEFIFNKEPKIGEEIGIKIYKRKLEDFLILDLGDHYNLTEIFDFINDNIPVSEKISEIYNTQRKFQKDKDDEFDILKTIIQDNMQLVSSPNKFYEFMFGFDTQMTRSIFDKGFGELCSNDCTIKSIKYNNRIVVTASSEYSDDMVVTDGKLYLWKSDELPTDKVIVIEERD